MGVQRIDRDTFLSVFNNIDVKSYAQYDTEVTDPNMGLVLFAQAILETGNFTSNAFVTAKNMFGMHASRSRKKIWDFKWTADGGELAGYDDVNMAGVEKSMADRLNLDVYNNVGWYGDAGRYMDDVLRKGYSVTKDYKDRWVKTLNTVCDQAGITRIDVKGYSDGTKSPVTNKEGTVTDGGTADPGKTENTFFGGEFFKKFGMEVVIGVVVAIVVYFIIKR